MMAHVQELGDLKKTVGHAGILLRDSNGVVAGFCERLAQTASDAVF